METNKFIEVCFFIVCSTLFQNCLTEPLRPDLPKDDVGTWAFQKHSDLSYYAEEGFVEMKNLNFGAFGSSKVSIGVRCVSCIENIKNNIYFHFDYEYTPPSTPRIIDIQLATDASNRDSTINFELFSREGTHDVYIYFPLDFLSTDLMFVRFHSADPTPGQWYYAIVHWNGKALTGCNHGEYACIHPLHGGKSQAIKFDKDSSGGYRIVSGFDDKVWSVKDGSSEDHTILVSQKFNNLPHQIWYIEEIDNAYRFHPKHNVTKCLDLDWGHNQNGAKLVSHVCNNTPAQTYNIIKSCSYGA